MDGPTCQNSYCAAKPKHVREVLQQVYPDRAVIRDDDRETCRVCGELPANSTTWPDAASGASAPSKTMRCSNAR